MFSVEFDRDALRAMLILRGPTQLYVLHICLRMRLSLSAPVGDRT